MNYYLRTWDGRRISQAENLKALFEAAKEYLENETRRYHDLVVWYEDPDGPNRKVMAIVTWSTTENGVLWLEV